MVALFRILSLPASLPPSLPASLPASIHPCLPASLPACLPPCLPACLPPSLPLCETNFRLCFGPSQNLSVDEAMIQFDGRLSWKQFMPKKPVKWGLKLWCLCDSDTGYCVAFNVYIGSNRDNQQANLDLGYRVVMGLIPNYLNKHYHVFADNFFTSVHLAEALLQAGTYLCGTTRGTRRDFPNTRQCQVAGWRVCRGLTSQMS